MNERKFSTLQLTTDAMLAAMTAVLGYVSIDIVNFKLSFEIFPVLVSSLLFGPLDGALVGLIGTLIYQVLRYGFEASTMLWVIPYLIIGLIVGFYARKYKYNNSVKQIRLIVGIAVLTEFILNTVALYFYAGMIGKVGTEFVLSSIIQRFVVTVVKGVGFGLVMTPLLKALHRYKRVIK